MIFVSDGTLSSNSPGERTNAGRLAALLSEIGSGARQIAHYDRGVQGEGAERIVNAITGRTFNLSILRGYAFLASRYRPGDRIYLFGYSRGAYAVRSLAGMIGRVGLLHSHMATERNIRLAFRHYEARTPRPSLGAFRKFCDTSARIEMLGVWDTVRALGFRMPVLDRMSPMATDFHDHALGPNIDHGYHALALDEDLPAYQPIMWEKSEDWEGRLEQCWFSGCHADVGGEVRHSPASRGLSNIPRNWMLRRATRQGVELPLGWQGRFPEDPNAPSSADRPSVWWAVPVRRRRQTGYGDGETVHMSVRSRMNAVRGYNPLAGPGALPA